MHKLGYSFHSNARTPEVAQYPDLDAQFQYVADQTRRTQRNGQPATSVETEKNKLASAFKNVGRTWRPAGTSEPVRANAFILPATITPGSNATIHGAYDL